MKVFQFLKKELFYAGLSKEEFQQVQRAFIDEQAKHPAMQVYWTR